MGLARFEEISYISSWLGSCWYNCLPHEPCVITLYNFPPHPGAGIAIKGDTWVSGWYPAATELTVLKKAYSSFEGVSVTTVILAPGACGLGLRAALLDTTSPAPAAPAAPAAPVAVFQKSPISCYLPYLRARGPLLISHPFF